MSSKVPSNQVAQSRKTNSKISPLALAAIAIGLIIIFGVLYEWWTSPEPPCSTCHIERRNNGNAVEECRLNGRIRHDWNTDLAPLFAMVDKNPLKDPVDPNGYAAGECLDIAVACLDEKELAKMELKFFNQIKQQVWSNPLCVGNCPHCP